MPLPPWLRQPSLQFVIAVPFVLQILVLAGLLGGISLRNSEKSTEKLVQALLTETGNHIIDNISDFLLSSVRVVDDNQHLLSAGVLPVDELSGWAPYLWNIASDGLVRTKACGTPHPRHPKEPHTPQSACTDDA